MSQLRTSGGHRTLDVLQGETREVRRRWFEHVQRRDIGFTDRRRLRFELADSSSTGGPERRLMDAVKDVEGEMEVSPSRDRPKGEVQGKQMTHHCATVTSAS